MEEKYICCKPCKFRTDSKKEWDDHMRTVHTNDRLCNATAPLFKGFVTCDKWKGHNGKHEALGYEWVETDSCAICGEKHGANEQHWRAKHLKQEVD